jgi:hypothetical protein
MKHLIPNSGVKHLEPARGRNSARLGLVQSCVVELFFETSAKAVSTKSAEGHSYKSEEGGKAKPQRCVHIGNCSYKFRESFKAGTG